MTQQEIQQLIDSYLDGKTTPEEELQLSQALRSVCGDAIATLPPEWQAILLMLDPLAEGEAEYDRIMESRQHKTRTVSLTWRWTAAALAVAASFLLLFLLSHKGTEPTAPQQMVAQQLPSGQEEHQAQPQPAPSETVAVEVTQEEEPVASTPSENKKQSRSLERNRAKRPQSTKVVATAVIPDTLGQDLWQSKENVLRALQMLADCEATIAREEQEIRNSIVKATFNATPQPANAILVTNELGDYEVIEKRIIINI